MAGRHRPPTDPLSLKIPVNPKYKDVKATIDTGASMSKYLERVRELKSNYKYKKGELFKRIKVTSLVGLMIEISEMNAKKAPPRTRPLSSDPTLSTIAENPESTSANDVESCGRPSSAATTASIALSTSSRHSSFLPPPPPPLLPGSASTRLTRSSSRTSRSAMTPEITPQYFPHPSSLHFSSEASCIADLSGPSISRPFSRPSTRPTSSLQGLVTGFGERTLEEEAEADKENASSLASPPPLEPPYLLLDIRDEDAFAAAHLRTAKNFPTSRLSRAFQFETKDLRAFCNKEGKIIVVYDEDESLAPRAATILVERGYENVFMLSGGINVARKFFPDGLVVENRSRPTNPVKTRGANESAVVLSSEEVSSLRGLMEQAATASSPSHKPTIQTTFDRRRTQMFGAQVKGRNGRAPVF